MKHLILKSVKEREARELVAAGGWAQDGEVNALMSGSAFVNSDNQVLSFMKGSRQAVVFRNRCELLAFLQQDHAPVHVLDGRFPFADEFPSKVESLISTFIALERLPPTLMDLSEESLKVIDELTRKRGRKDDLLSSERFPMLVAYVGEVMRRYTHGAWHMVKAGSVWEPWIATPEDGMLAPFMLVFRELKSGRGGSISGAVDGTLRASLLG